ncbi:hypothetical protein FOCC_FOCC006210 [Frankliniella occidentalis]|nr:hypothetical protein FOCC_FOCC006210 [Frankliniella occidentalis]
MCIFVDIQCFVSDNGGTSSPCEDYIILGDDADVKPAIARFNKPYTDNDKPDIIEISDDSEDELQSCISQSFDETLSVVCIICSKQIVQSSLTCNSCCTVVHMECSVICPDDNEKRICSNCFCLLCKKRGGPHHICECSICEFPIGDTGGIICYRCEKLCHEEDCSKKITAKEKDNVERYICQHCSHTLTVGIPLAAWNDLLYNKMLTDHHVARACTLLRGQFRDEIDGLCDPLGVSFGREVENIHHYHPKTDIKDYVQIMYTGADHWVTAIFKKGLKSVTIMDSLQSRTAVSGHIEIQIGMVAQTPGVISVTTQFIDYDEAMFREHWGNCLLKNELSPFPRLSKRVKKTKLENEVTFLRINCLLCLLPDNYSDMISCDQCDDWYHKICVGLSASFDDNNPWNCTNCPDLEEQ